MSGYAKAIYELPLDKGNLPSAAAVKLGADADKKIKKLLLVLHKHHDWHLMQSDHPEEYADSELCEQTVDCLKINSGL